VLIHPQPSLCLRRPIATLKVYLIPFLLINVIKCKNMKIILTFCWIFKKNVLDLQPKNTRKNNTKQKMVCLFFKV
jgi:hypothetical protein